MSWSLPLCGTLLILETMTEEYLINFTEHMLLYGNETVSLEKRLMYTIFWLTGDRMVEVWRLGDVKWFKKINNRLQLHRENGPAVVCPDGSKQWWENNTPTRYQSPDGKFHYVRELNANSFDTCTK